MKSKLILKSLIILVITVSSCISCNNNNTTKTNSPVVIAYLPSYEVDDFYVGHYDKITHVIYKQMKPLADGELSFNKLGFRNIKIIKNQIKDKEVKLLVGVAGGAASGYSEFMDILTRDAKARENLAKNLKAFCFDNGIDGVDINWEHPKSDEQRDNLALTVNCIAKEFKGTDLELTAAFNSSAKCGLQTAKRLAPFVKYVSIMTYDMFSKNSHAPIALYKRVINNYINSGIPKSKIVPGLPFYGKEIMKKSYGKPCRSAIAYNKVMKLNKNIAPTINFINVNKPYNDSTYVVKYSFDGIDKIRAKTKFTLQQGLAGVMIWQIGQDIASSSEKSLLSVVDQVIGEK